MREIKFRVWDEFQKYMDYEVYGMGGQGDYCVDINDFLKEHSEFLMQYTGLKDKNGREIYEGDCFIKVISYIDFVEPITFTKKEVCVVKFHEGKFMVYQDGWGYFDLIDVINQRVDGTDCWESGEVVGNIYENPELLKTN